MRNILGDQYALFFITLWVLWTCFFIFNLVLFFLKKNSIYIKCRAPYLILCSALGQYGMMSTLCWKIILLPENFPNIVDHWFIWLFIPLHLLPYPIRALRFIIIYNVNNFEYEEILRAKNSNGKTKRGLRDRTSKIWKWFSTHPKWRSDNAFLIFNWILMACAIAIGVYRNIVVESNHPGNYGAPNSSMFFISCIVLFVLVSVFVWAAVIVLLKIKDELFYNFELMTIGILWAVFITLYIVFGWAKIGTFQLPSIFAIILCLSSFLVSFGMPVQLSYVKKRDVVYGEKILDSLEELLKNEEAVEVFHKFLNRKMATECLLFYQAVNKFREESNLSKKKEMFKEIKETYVKAGSPYQINILARTRETVMATKHLTDDVFTEAFQQNYHVMKTDIYREFKTSLAAKEFAKQLRAKHSI